MKLRYLTVSHFDGRKRNVIETSAEEGIGSMNTERSKYSWKLNGQLEEERVSGFEGDWTPKTQDESDSHALKLPFTQSTHDNVN